MGAPLRSIGAVKRARTSPAMARLKRLGRQAMIPLVLTGGLASAVALMLGGAKTLVPAPPAAPAPRAVKPAPVPPPALQARIDALGEAYGDRAGIAVHDLEAGWTAAYAPDDLFPQQSVSKLWVAITVLDLADQGKVDLDQAVTIRKSDLSLFHQPLRKLVGEGSYTTTPRDLLSRAITQSDNTANDALARLAGGPAEVQAMIARKQLVDVHMGPGERRLQTEAAGLTWRAEYSFGHTFWEARDRLPDAVRRQALYRYLLNPPDAASPRGVVTALERLQRGQLLSPASTDLLLELMSHTETGASRLKAGLTPGWTLRHKTGTGQVMGPVATGFNDVGLLTSPEGHTYAVAVLIGRTARPIEDRQALMAEVTRAVEESP